MENQLVKKMETEPKTRATLKGEGGEKTCEDTLTFPFRCSQKRTDKRVEQNGVYPWTLVTTYPDSEEAMD